MVAATAVAGIHAVTARCCRIILGSRDWQRAVLVMPNVCLVWLRLHRLCGNDVQNARSRHR
jgi:hypothetical protein